MIMMWRLFLDGTQKHSARICDECTNGETTVVPRLLQKVCMHMIMMWRLFLDGMQRHSARICVECTNGETTVVPRLLQKVCMHMIMRWRLCLDGMHMHDILHHYLSWQMLKWGLPLQECTHKIMTRRILNGVPRLRLLLLGQGQVDCWRIKIPLQKKEAREQEKKPQPVGRSAFILEGL